MSNYERRLAPDHPDVINLERFKRNFSEKLNDHLKSMNEHYEQNLVPSFMTVPDLNKKAP